MIYTEIVSEKQYQFFLDKARRKIEIEKWSGRDHEVKTTNFANSYTTEYAFVRLLKEYNIKHKHRGFFYIGDATHAPDDINVWIDSVMVEIDIHSTRMSSMIKYGNILYPQDRYLQCKRGNKEFPEFLIPCSIEPRNNGIYVNFYGFYTKDKLVELLDIADVNGGRIYSKRNQEILLTISAIPDRDLKELLAMCEKNETNN